MEKVEFIQIASIEGIEETHALIEHADGSFTSMLKSTYDAIQAEQSTPMVSDEAKAK